jgi:hypothetical protein
MIGWRARLGFLLPPGNPTVEGEMIALAPEGVSVHFHRMAAYGAPGSLDGQYERTRTMIDNIDGSIELLASVEPDVIVVAHTATSYYLGREGESDLLARLEKSTGKRVITAFGSVLRALERLNVRRLALGAPYSRETTLQGKVHLDAWPRGRQFRQSAGGHEHLRRDCGAGLRVGAAGRQRGRRSRLSQRDRPADIAGIGDAGAGSGEAGHLECFRDDVARAASCRR